MFWSIISDFLRKWSCHLWKRSALFLLADLYALSCLILTRTSRVMLKRNSEREYPCLSPTLWHTCGWMQGTWLCPGHNSPVTLQGGVIWEHRQDYGHLCLGHFDTSQGLWMWGSSGIKICACCIHPRFWYLYLTWELEVWKWNLEARNLLFCSLKRTLRSLAKIQ